MSEVEVIELTMRAAKDQTNYYADVISSIEGISVKGNALDRLAALYGIKRYGGDYDLIFESDVSLQGRLLKHMIGKRA